MSRKNNFDPQALCAGGTVFIEFMSLLKKALEKHGASAHMIRFMTLPQNAEKFDEWIKFGISQIYPVPRSLIEQLVEQHVRDEDDGGTEQELLDERIESDRIYWWDVIDLETTFGIPVVALRYPVNKEVRNQIVGKTLDTNPIAVEYRDEPHLVVSIYYEGDLANGNRPHPGFVYDDYLTDVFLAPARYFDLEN